uniref:PAS domain-containing protein n=1 Tax=Plectus sambesii TaxID=2011161 RepID=A0A914VUE3_9BILA
MCQTAQTVSNAVLRLNRLLDDGDDSWKLRLEPKAKKKKRGCLVCVARRISGEKSPIEGGNAVLSPSIAFMLDSGNRISDVDLKDISLGIKPADLIGKTIRELCWKADSAVLDTLLDSVTDCSGELRLRVIDCTLTVQARAVKTRLSDHPIRLECALLRSECGAKDAHLHHNHPLPPPAPPPPQLQQASHQLQQLQQTLKQPELLPASPASIVAYPSTAFENLSPATTDQPDQSGGGGGGGDQLHQLCSSLFDNGDSMDVSGSYSAPPLAQEARAFQFPVFSQQHSAKYMVSDQTPVYYHQQMSAEGYPCVSTEDLPSSAYGLQKDDGAPPAKVPKPKKSRAKAPAANKTPGGSRGRRRKSAAGAMVMEQPPVTSSTVMRAPWEQPSPLSGAPKVRDALLKVVVVVIVQQ